MTIGGRSNVGTPVSRRREPNLGAPAVSAVYLETFPNDGTLGTTTEDLTWVQTNGGTPQVISSKGTAHGGLGEAFAQHDTPTSDMYVQATLSGFGQAGVGVRGDLFLVGRADGGGVVQGVYLYVSSSVGDASTYIEIGGWVPSGVIDSDTLLSSANTTWRLECSGTTIRALRNSVEVLTGVSSLSPQPAGTRAGFQIAMDSGGPYAAIDNFEYGGL